MPSASVMLRRDWGTSFRRTVTEESGQKTLLEFEPGVPVELDASILDKIKDDIGKALLPVEFDEKDRPRVIDGDVEVDQSPPSEGTQQSHHQRKKRR